VHPFLSVKRNFGDNQQLDRFGGVVVRSSARFTDVTTLSDLNKHASVTMCGVNENAFGGWQIQLYELVLQGVDLSRIVPVFMKKHELSLNASIVDKTCDFAVARTETLERQVKLGEYAESDFFTVGEKGPALNFPQHLSTVLYPEWPIASLSHVPRDIEQIIAIPLLTLTRTTPEAIAGEYAGFTFPYSYEPVRQMFIGIDKDKTGRCDPGHSRVGTMPGLCQACPSGSFSTDGLPGKCMPCPVGTVNNASGSASCDFCPGELTTARMGSVSGQCIPAQKQDDETIGIAIGAGAVVLVLGAALCYVVYRNSEGVWDVFILIVSDFFLTMVSFGFELIDILTDWFAYMQIVDLKYSATHPELFIAYSVMLAVSTIVSAVNIVVRLVVAYKMSQEATTLSHAKKKTQLRSTTSLKAMRSGESLTEVGLTVAERELSSGGLTVNTRMNLADMAQLGAVDNADVTEEMLRRMDMDELRGNSITVKRLLLTRQASLAVALLEDIPMIILNAIVLDQNHNQVIMVATFLSCTLLGNKMYPLKQTFKLRAMDTMIRNVVYQRNVDEAMCSWGKGGTGRAEQLQSHPMNRNGAVTQTAAAGVGIAGSSVAAGVILMV